MSDPQSAALHLRHRLLVTLGLVAPTLPGCYPFFQKCDPLEYTETVSLSALAGDTASDTGPDSGADTGSEVPTVCPTDLVEIDALLNANGLYCNVEEATLVEQVGDQCTYDYTCFSCCGYGRPYLDERGAPVKADTAPTAAWATGPDRPDPSALSDEARRLIGAYWRKNATAEHSSVAGFHRFALDLLTHGAPPELVARAQRAAAQELRHAVDCFTLASAYLGEPVGPAPMALGASAPIASSLAELAAWTARDGAIGETLAAFLAEQALAETTEPAVRRVLERIVADETEHAALAWATLRWAIEVGGDEVRAAVSRVFAGLIQPRSEPMDWSPALGAHGVPRPEDEEAHAAVAVSRVILPVARALLASTPEAQLEAPHRQPWGA